MTHDVYFRQGMFGKLDERGQKEIAALAILSCGADSISKESANNLVKRIYGVSIDEAVIVSTTGDCEDEPNFLTTRQLSIKGDLPMTLLNKQLEELGFQRKISKRWKLTEEGKIFGSYFYCRTSRGIRWKASILSIEGIGA